MCCNFICVVSVSSSVIRVIVVVIRVIIVICFGLDVSENMFWSLCGGRWLRSFWLCFIVSCFEM